MSAPFRSHRFPTTAWSAIQIIQTAEPSHPQFIEAANRLIAAYWRPAFHFLRTRGLPAEAAEDATQQFFCKCILEDQLNTTDASRGGFRNLLKTMLRRFHYDATRRPGEQVKWERQFASFTSLLTDEDRQYEPPAGETAEQAFQRQCQSGLLTRVKHNLKTYYEGLDAEEFTKYQIFAEYHLVAGREEQPSQEELARRFGVSRDRVRGALESVTARYRRYVLQEIRSDVGTEEDVPAELNSLRENAGEILKWSE